MHTERVNFDELVARAMAQPGRAAMRPVIEKERTATMLDSPFLDLTQPCEACDG